MSTEIKRPASALLLTRAELASEMRVSAKSVDRHDQRGLIPAPLLIGGRKRWLRSEIEAWLAAGAPNRAAWEAMKVDGRPSFGGFRKSSPAPHSAQKIGGAVVPLGYTDDRNDTSENGSVGRGR